LLTKSDRGEKLIDLLKTTTVEGVPTAQVAVYFADKCGLDLPIFRAVASIIEGEELLEVRDYSSASLLFPSSLLPVSFSLFLLLS
jgi:glycerol-3-phosphate dehydrogenase